DPRFTEYAERERSTDGSADGVRDGVQCQDRRDRLVDVAAHGRQQMASAVAALLQKRNIRVGNGKEHGLEYRAGERNQQSDPDNQQQNRHGTSMSCPTISAGNAETDARDFSGMSG